MMGSAHALEAWPDLEDFFENATVSRHFVDKDGTILRANKAELELLGYAAEEYVGRNIVEFHADRHAVDDILKRLRHGERLDKYPARLVAKDGGIKHVLISSSGQFRNGKSVNSRCFTLDTLDVTPWRLAEHALREQDQRLAATYEHAAIAISEVDEKGRLLRVNETTCAITGYLRDELLGRSVFDLTHPEDREPDIESLRQQVAGKGAGRSIVERRMVRKDGGAIWVSVASSAVRDDASGKFLYGIRVMQDITLARHAQEALRDEEQRFRELLEALPAAVYTTDTEGRITFYNRAASELAGRQPELGSDTWCVTWRLYHPDGTPLPHDQCPMALALKEERPIRGSEAIAERPDGTRVPVIPYPTPIRDASGRLIGAVNMLVDVSERKQAEANQKVLLDELNHRVKNNMQMLYALLQTALRETASTEARAVLAEASHRVSAMGAAHQVLYEMGNTVSYNAKDLLERVCASAKRAFVRNVNVVILDCTAERLSNDTAVPLALILNEFLINAANYGVSNDNGRSIRVSLTKNDGSLQLDVADDGPGFDLVHAQRRSSGLGLVNGLARQLGGTLTVERTPGASCKVRFVDRLMTH